MSSAPPSRWLHGPVSDLLFGCGLLYLVVFGILAAWGTEVRSLLPFGLLPLIALVTGTPHYGATLLRVYQHRNDRRTYALFSVWATLLVLFAFVVSLHSYLLGSILFTVYLTWSPWHYTGQNYGLALVFLRRRGVAVTPGLKRAIYCTFVLSYVLTFLAIHVEDPSAAYAPNATHGETFRFLPVGIPTAFQQAVLLLAALGYVGSLAVAGTLLLRRASFRDVAPAALITLTQALWFAVPVAARSAGVAEGVDPLSTRYAAYAFTYAAFAHAVQYLWVTSYYARTSERSQLRYLGKCLLAGAALWGLPALLFAPRLLGPLPYDAGLDVLIVAAVNIHHFILDGAIWKLRDGKVARVLLRPAEPSSDAPVGPGRLGWVRPAVWVAGSVCVLVTVVGVLETEYGVRRAARDGDLERMRTASERLTWVGRESATLHYQIAQAEAAGNDTRAALERIDRGLAIHPTTALWVARGNLQLKLHDWEGATESFDAAIEGRPDHVDALYGSAYANLQLRRTSEALGELEEAARLAPEREDVTLALQQLRQRLQATP